jgi:hypothetical protein
VPGADYSNLILSFKEFLQGVGKGLDSCSRCFLDKDIARFPM